MILLAFLLRVAIGVVLLRAAAMKIRNGAGFRQAVRNYELLPACLVGVVARGLPVAELVAGGLLVLGVELQPVSIVVVLLLLVFCGAVAVNLLRGRTISCGCSGAVASDISWRHVIWNCVIAAAAVIVALWAAQPLSVFAGVSDPRGSAAWASRALAWLLIMFSAAVAALLAAEARRVMVGLRRIEPVTEEGGR